MTEKATRLKSREVGVSVSGHPSAGPYSITGLVQRSIYYIKFITQ
jgi:hypothetical protein